MSAIRQLIEDAKAWRLEHKRHGRQVEALACDIRIDALKQALDALEPQP